MLKQLYSWVLIELGEVLQPSCLQKKLGVEYANPIELVAEERYRNGRFVYHLRRTSDNYRGNDSYVRPNVLQAELQYILDLRRKTEASVTRWLCLNVAVIEEDADRYYKIFISVGGRENG